MDPINISKFNNLEKAMSLRWSLTLLATFAFIDFYLILNFNFGVSEITTLWIKSNIGVLELVTLFVTFSISFGILIPGAGFLFTAIYGLLSYYLQSKKKFSFPKNENDLSKDPSYVKTEDYRLWAIKNSNSAAYRDYERVLAEKFDVKFIRYMCRCCVLLTLFSILLTEVRDTTALSYIQFLYSELEKSHWVFEYLVKGAITCMGIFILGMGFSEESHYDNYMQFDKSDIAQ